MSIRLRRKAVLGVVAAAAVVVGAAAPAGAAPNPYPQQPLDLWGQNGTAFAVEIVGNTAYIGGAFTAARRYAQSQPRLNLMAINMAANPPSNSLLPFQADTNEGGTVRALASDGTWLYVGGQFTSIDGVPRNRLARINLANGQVDQGFNYNVNNTVRDLLVVNVNNVNTLFMVGDFTAINGTARRRAAAINLADGQLTLFNPNLNAKTYAVAYSAAAGQVLVGGNFTTVGGMARSFLAALSPTNGALQGQPYNSLGDVVLDITTGNAGNGERVFVAGGGGFNSAAAWNIGGGARLWRQQANGDVQAVRFAANNVYFGFHDGFGGNTTLRLLAADAVSGALVPGFAPASSGAIGVMAIDIDGPYLVSAGKFPRMGGVAVKGASVHRTP